MKIILNNTDLNKALENIKLLGFVPTMGFLHNGHVSLIKKSKKICKKTIVSIFINPTQFNNKNDFKKYPKNLNNDLKILKKNKVDFVYIPKVKDIYNFKRKVKIKINSNDQILCAKFRKNHFEGVLDVMDRFVKIIKPIKIFMGEKDFQQIYLVKKFIEQKYKSKIISCKTIRDEENLPLSSRNFLLSKTDISNARNVSQELIKLKRQFKIKKIPKNFLLNKKKNLEKEFKIKIDYLELRKLKNLYNSKKILNSRFFIAYHINHVRLIDNF
ncbi:MAG: pantoate--beta-alanine ligase [Pelagibacteraceae bacterium]|nr:pantoate--beta-alanine ligase [Pelagibacteraceae bacterium]